MSEPKVVFEPVLGRWRVEYKVAYGRWEAQRHFPSRGAAVAYAQERRDKDPSTLTDWRVVDTHPDAEDEHAPIVIHSCDDHAHVFVPHNPRLYDYVPGEGLFIRERSRPEPKPRPWKEAKPGEVWVLTRWGTAEPFLVTGGEFITADLAVIVDLDDDSITAGHRIWPEPNGSGDES